MRSFWQWGAGEWLWQRIVKSGTSKLETPGHVLDLLLSFSNFDNLWIF
jgi:hypothetical protein